MPRKEFNFLPSQILDRLSLSMTQTLSDPVCMPGLFFSFGFLIDIVDIHEITFSVLLFDFVGLLLCDFPATICI